MNTVMIKNLTLWGLELMMTITLFGYNLEIGSTAYNWLSALWGGGLFFALMYYDQKVDNRAAAKMAFLGPTIAVVFAPLVCEYYNISFDRPHAKAIYMLIGFFGLVLVRIMYGLSGIMEREVAVLLWNIVKERLLGSKNTPPKDEGNQ